jgi:hypothetical protein
LICALVSVYLLSVITMTKHLTKAN